MLGNMKLRLRQLILFCGLLISFVAFQNVSPPPNGGFQTALTGCNTAAWDQIPMQNGNSGFPGHRNLFVGRELAAGGCDTSQGWKMTLASMNWSTKQLTIVNPSFFTVPMTIYGGINISDAYDATVFWNNGELWVAFECASIYGTGSCMGPVDTKNDSSGATWRVIPSRTTLVVKTNCDGVQCHSASVPKIFMFRNKPYMYYSIVHYRQDNFLWINASTRGIELKNSKSSPGGYFWALNTPGSPVNAVDSNSTEVMKLDPGDPLSDQVADGFGVYTDGPVGNETNIYMTGALGGSSNKSCIVPTGGIDMENSIGCYRQFIARSTTPLGDGIFNAFRVSERESYMPSNGTQYFRRFFDNNGNPFVWGLYFPAPAGVPIGKKDWAFPYMTAYPLNLSNLNYQLTHTWSGAGQLYGTPGFTQSFANGYIKYNTNGSLALYNVYNTELWTTGAKASNYCSGANCQMQFQSDGNLVLYKNGSPYWASGTNGIGAYVIFGIRPYYYHAGIQNSAWQWVWNGDGPPPPPPSQVPPGTVLSAGSSITTPDGQATLVMQGDGNLVMYSNSGGGALWASSWRPDLYQSGTNYQANTYCPNCTAVFQGDGNIVLYNGNFYGNIYHAYWASNTNLPGPSYKIYSVAPFIEIFNSGGGSVWRAW